MTQTIPARPGVAGTHTECPHCHKDFVARMDSTQPPRLQGAKCPHCKLFVPARLLPEKLVLPARTPAQTAVKARPGKPRQKLVKKPVPTAPKKAAAKPSSKRAGQR